MPVSPSYKYIYSKKRFLQCVIKSNQYDEEYDIAEMKNALGENTKFNIIFTVEPPMDFEEKGFRMCRV